MCKVVTSSRCPCFSFSPVARIKKPLHNHRVRQGGEGEVQSMEELILAKKLLFSDSLFSSLSEGSQNFVCGILLCETIIPIVFFLQTGKKF